MWFEIERFRDGSGSWKEHSKVKFWNNMTHESWVIYVVDPSLFHGT